MRHGLVASTLFRSLAFACSFLAAGGAAWALTDEEIFREFRFNFVNPGARALGMGGAFVAIADDATAAEANPAGLWAVDDPEVFVELRSVNPDTETFSSSFGSLEVDPENGARELPFLGLTSVSNPDSVSELSYVSVAWPVRVAGRPLTVAGSRLVLLSDDRTLSSGSTATEARFAFDSYPNTVNGDQVEAYSISAPLEGSRSMEITHWNASASYEVHRDFSVGATLTYSALDLTADTSTRVIDPLELFLDPAHPRLPSQPTSDLSRTHIDDTDSDVTYSIGLHWHPNSVFASGVSPWSFGAVFRSGAGFEVTETTLLNEIEDETFVNEIAVPDRFAVGVGYRFAEQWLVAFEFERIEYTDLLKGFRSGVNLLTGDRLAVGAFDTSPDEEVAFTVNDGNVPRVGVEYVHPFVGRPADRIFARAGYYREPDSRVHMERFISDDPDVNEAFLRAFGEGDDVDHFTAGVGFAFGRSSFNFAADLSDAGSQVVGSYTYAFGD